MAKLKLEFISPKVLNELKFGQFVEKSVWKYFGMPDSSLFIDTDTWIISSEDGSKSAVISNWCVNEQAKEFVLKDQSSSVGFKDIDYTFALAMLGQLTDRNGLINYLASLKDIFNGVIPSKQDTESDEESEVFDNNSK